MTYLKPKHIVKLFYWAIFRPYKVLVMKFWEDKGMTDLSAMKQAEKTSRVQYKTLSQL